MSIKKSLTTLFFIFLFSFLRLHAQVSAVTAGVDFIWYGGGNNTGVTVTTQYCRVQWVTEGERSVTNYQVERSQTGGAPWTVVSTKLPTNLNGVGQTRYIFDDNVPCPGAGTRKYIFYRVTIYRASPPATFTTQIIVTRPMAYCK